MVSIRPTATPITTATPTSSSSASGPTANGSTVIDPNSVLSGEWGEGCEEGSGLVPSDMIGKGVTGSCVIARV